MKKKLETPYVVSYRFEGETAEKNLILAMKDERPIAQVNPEVPVKKVV